MYVNNIREIKRSASCILTSTLLHTSLIVVLAVVFWPVTNRATISLESQMPLYDVVTSFESNDMLKSVEQKIDDSLFDPIESEPWTTDLASNDVVMVADFEHFGLESNDPFDLYTAAPSAESLGFFGIQPYGERIVYIIDISRSMSARGRYHTRYERAVKALMQSVEQLDVHQQFYVFLFSFTTDRMKIDGDRFCFSTKETQAKLREWLESRRLGSGTDPREALAEAFSLQPSCIFLLSDGEFNGVQYRNGKFGGEISTVELCKKLNKSRCPIHTIGLEDLDNQVNLKAISKQSGGIYQFIPKTD